MYDIWTKLWLMIQKTKVWSTYHKGEDVEASFKLECAGKSKLIWTELTLNRGDPSLLFLLQPRFPWIIQKMLTQMM